MANILPAERGPTPIQLVRENWVTNLIKRLGNRVIENRLLLSYHHYWMDDHSVHYLQRKVPIEGWY
jgi:hypothetical protein